MGSPIYSAKKFEELVLYIAVKSEGFPHFGKVKLNKDLFFSDFRAYRELGSAITGAEYIKNPYGPVARELEAVLNKLRDDGSGLVRRNLIPGRREQLRLIALRPPDLNPFTGPEIALVDAVIDDLRDLTAEEVSKLSHEFPGYKLADMEEAIPYETVFLPDADDPERLSADELEQFRRDIAGDEPKG